MPLFQASVLNSHLRQQDARQLEEAYHNFTAYFHNPVIQENIRNSKEEQFQATFLNELFVKVLGYTLNPNPEYNLTTEFKNDSNNRKADGAILSNGTALGVIELKGTNTKDLESIRRQAFDYKANQKGCVYVITSNFEKLRFYVNDATEFEEFNLFELGKEEFALLLLCLGKENLLSNLPLKIKEASLVVEEEITKKFYSDYSVFKRELYQDLVKRNLQKLRTLQLVPVELESAPEEEAEQEKAIKLNLFKKSQKLIDRFLFVFFAEDRNLLPPNSAMQILDKWKADMDFGDERPLYDLFRQYFGYLHTGRQSTASRAEIYAYNGGLFKPDEILDTVEIGSEMLYKHSRKLASYDFESQVDVNILGHIFENSLNEIEGMTSEIEGTDFEKQKSKRKKDGVFYTPKYITKYIVENTVGRLCAEKKEALGFREEEYYEGRSKKHKKTIVNLVKVLDDYRDWLLQLSICDPACGSGAFLNQALDFLIREHRYIDELKTKLLGGSLVLSDIENTILENNIYGVDINEESVEIAKLSLWLRTAQPRRKLNDLSSNIKCGNSLIDDPAVAGEKAFKWEEEFPEIFAKGGFDVVIGNPPYGADLSDIKPVYFETHFRTFEYQVNSYVLFYEKGLEIVKVAGILGYITPATFTYQHYFKKLRQLFNDFEILAITKYFYEVFEDADIGDSVSWIIRKAPNSHSEIEINRCRNREDAAGLFNVEVNYEEVVNIDGTYNLTDSGLNLKNLYINSEPLGKIAQIVVGIKAYQTKKGKPKQTREIVKEKIFTSDRKINDTYIQCVIGKDFHRYKFLQEPGMYLSYGEWLAEPRGIAPFFKDEKIIIRQTADSIIGTLDRDQRINLNNVYNIFSLTENISNHYLLGILNSRLLNMIYQNISQEKGRTFAEVKKVNLEKLPIKYQPLSSSQIERKVNLLIDLNTELGILLKKFRDYLSHTLGIINPSNKVLSWYTLEFGEFIKELNKAIAVTNKLRVKEEIPSIPGLSKKDEFGWMELFEENKLKAQKLQQQIGVTDREIDQLVYELYGLTVDEIEVVEQA